MERNRSMTQNRKQTSAMTCDWFYCWRFMTQQQSLASWLDTRYQTSLKVIVKSKDAFPVITLLTSPQLSSQWRVQWIDVKENQQSTQKNKRIRFAKWQCNLWLLASWTNSSQIKLISGEWRNKRLVSYVKLNKEKKWIWLVPPWRVQKLCGCVVATHKHCVNSPFLEHTLLSNRRTAEFKLSSHHACSTSSKGLLKRSVT